MSRAVTIKQLEEDVRWQADQERADLRHTSTKVRRAINQSIQRYRERITRSGGSYFLKGHSGKLEKGPATDSDTGDKFSWGLLDTESIEPEVVRIYGLDVTVNNVRQELDLVQFSERNYYQFGNIESHIPVAYFYYDEYKIGILPPSDRQYSYTLWYLPKLPELMNDDDEFNPGLPNGEMWVIWDVMHKLLNRDNYPDLIRSVNFERQKLMDELMAQASYKDRSRSVKRRDSRNRTRNKRDLFYYYSNVASGNIG